MPSTKKGALGRHLFLLTDVVTLTVRLGTISAVVLSLRSNKRYACGIPSIMSRPHPAPSADPLGQVSTRFARNESLQMNSVDK